MAHISYNTATQAEHKNMRRLIYVALRPSITGMRGVLTKDGSTINLTIADPKSILNIESKGNSLIISGEKPVLARVEAALK